MRKDERQIRERIEIYEAQNEQYAEEVETAKEWSEKQLYRSWIRRNNDKIEELKWVLEILIRF
jgi:hypothetical protein